MTKHKIQNNAKAQITNGKTLVLVFVIVILSLFCHCDFDICHLRDGICQSSLLAQDKIIAIVNNDVITEKDLNDFLQFMRMQLSTEYKEKEVEGKIQSMKLDLLDRLIEDRLILQEAKRSKIKIDENRIKARIDEIKKNYTSDREFQNALARQGLVQADIESRIREQLLMHTIVEIKIKNKIIINPAEVTAFYEENREEFNLPEEREFESITVDNEDLAKEIYDKLRDGQDFQELAKNYSLAVNKSSTREGKLKDVVEAQIFKLHIGEYSSPIKIGDNHYIFKLDNIIPSRQQNLSEAQDNIYTFLFNKKMDEALTLWLEDLKKHSYIQIL